MTQPRLSFNAWLRYSLIRDFLRSGKRPPASFLEIGCGRGALGAVLSDAYEYVGYEPDPLSFSTAEARIAGRGTVLNESLPAEPYRTFDWVGAFEVLEHIEDDIAALGAWYKWVRPGGYVMLSVPAHPHRFASADRAVGHFRRYDRGRLSNVLCEAGFGEPQIQVYGFPLGYVLEFGRNMLMKADKQSTTAERTARSGRLLQTGDYLGRVAAFGTAPFRFLQRPFRETNLGTGFVAMAQRPT